MTLAQAAARLQAQAAAVAVAMTVSGATSTAEVQALAKIISVMALYPSESITIMERALSTPIDTNVVMY